MEFRRVILLSADAECASLNVRVFRIEARQVCSHRHTSQAPVRLDADLIVTDIFRPVSWLRGARFLRSRHAGIEATRIVATARRRIQRSEEHTSELQSLMRISYAVF